MNGSIMVVSCPYDYQPVTLEIKSAKSSTKSYIKGGIPHFTIKVKVSDIITEQGCSTNFNDEKKLRELERALEMSIRNDMQYTIAASKDMQIDFLGLRRILHTQHNKE